jgi:hypothetical protein
MALYGLKQAPRLWYHHINDFLLSLGFIQPDADPNLYYKMTQEEEIQAMLAKI